MKNRKHIIPMFALAATLAFPINSSASVSLDCSIITNIIGPDGYDCIGYFITNTSDEDVYVAMNLDYLDSDVYCIGSSSAFIPCLGAGQSTYIYVEDSLLEKAVYYNDLILCSPTDYESASEELEKYLLVGNYDSYYKFSVSNASGKTIMLPQVTMVFESNGEPVAIQTSTIYSDDSPVYYLEDGSTGTVDIDVPTDVHYDKYHYYITGYFGNTPTTSTD